MQTYKLLADDGAADDRFGNSVRMSGTTAIVGAFRDDDNGSNSGSAYLFDITTGQQIAKLLPDDGAPQDQFGRSVSIDANFAMVGSPSDDDNGDDSGSAYLFDPSTGQQITKLLPINGTVDGEFGKSVAVCEDIAIVGEPADDADLPGAAYLFNVSTGKQIAKLSADDGANGDRFGGSVAICGTTAIVGAYLDDDNGLNSGSAYLFDLKTGEQIAKLLPNDGAAGDRFGSVAIDEEIAVVGALFNDDNGESSGSAYIFNVSTGQQIAKLIPSDNAEGDRFGRTVAISGGIILVGANSDDDNGNDSGSAYLFDAVTAQQITKFLPADGAENARFGWSVAMCGSTAIIGAYQDDDNGEESGSAYLFDLSCGGVVEVSPDSFAVTRGTHVSGSVIELSESDNADLSIQRAVADIQSRTEFEVQAVSPVANPSSLEVTLEGSVFARSDVNQTIELFDYVTGVWEQVDTREASRFIDSTVTVAATGDLSRFVESGTNRIEARIRYQSPVARQQFSSNTDQFIWTIGQ